MQRNNISSKCVYNFTNMTLMKFKLSKNSFYQRREKNDNIINLLKSSLTQWFNSNSKNKNIKLEQQKQAEDNSRNKNRLKFIVKLNNDHFLIGNQYGIDIIFIGIVIDQFIDTQYVWSFQFNKQIKSVSVQNKKSLIAFMFEDQIQIYQYNFKKSKEKSSIINTIKINQNVQFMQFVKQSHITLLYPNHLEIHFIDQIAKTTKKIYSKKYQKPQNFMIFQVPQAFQGVMNVFFQNPIQQDSIFQLWNLQIILSNEGILMNNILKIYQISNALKSKIILSNYSKQIFCMNIGHQILAIKKGYIIDTALSNIQNQGAVLKYLGNDKLIHVTNHKIQLYKFSLNTFMNPPRIILQSEDSLYSKMTLPDYSFFDVLQMMNGNIVVLYQLNKNLSNSRQDQLSYAFCVTQKIKLQDKIKQILPSSQEIQRYKLKGFGKISQQDYSIIQQKCDMIMKMGLDRKQIYLKLWNNSSKQDLVDYQFLLGTLDYDSIREQIQKKLKKKSMSLRIVIKIQQGCLSMLQKNAFNHQTTFDQFKNYLISHFFLRKLKLYQKFIQIQKTLQNKYQYGYELGLQQQQKTMINIKDYSYFSKCDLKTLFIDLIKDFCKNQKQTTICKIRTIIKLFKFSLRPIYTELLQQIIKQAGQHLVSLFEYLPQLLPYQNSFLDYQSDASLYEGVWSDIKQQDWELNLYSGGIINIDNRQLVQDFKLNIWSKRFFLSLHDLLPYSKQQILQFHQKNKSEQTFYDFIEKAFDNIQNPTILQEIINYIQGKYNKLPQHLVDQIFLYRALYQYLKKQNGLKQTLAKEKFNQFLSLKDFQIFKMIFELQKRKKNCILKDIKQDIFNSKRFQNGNDIFNVGLLNFFSSNLSQISDIKYLLNRLNNQKIQFHQKNQGLYQVIVKGMQAKLFLGSDNDIPIDQVYIYITNIHIDQNSQIKKDLKIIDIINKYSRKFKEIKINMNIFQMIRQQQKVLNSVICYDIQNNKILQNNSIQQIIKTSILILQQCQKLRKQIYYESKYNPNLILFLYISKLLENEDFIAKGKQILISKQINQLYQINQTFIQNIVLFLYKWILHIDKIYKNNQSYLNKIIQLLPQQNQIRIMIKSQLCLTEILSCQNNLLQYPLGGYNSILSTVQLQSAIENIPGDHVALLDIERIYELALKIQQISSDGYISSINLTQIYQVAILKLLECKMIKQSIPMIRNLMELNPECQYNFIYPVLLIKKFSFQLCDENRFILFNILTYQYSNPLKLLNLIEQLLNKKSTSKQQKKFLNQRFQQLQKTKIIFNKNNQIFDSLYQQQLQTQKTIKSFQILLRKTFQKISKIKDQFNRNSQYSIIFAILINNPHAIIKYLYCSKYQTNFKGIRCFFSYLIKSQIFNDFRILELGKRIFYILYLGLTQNIYIQNFIDQYKTISLEQNMNIKKIKQDSNLAIVCWKNIQKFKIKLNQLQYKLKYKKISISQEQKISNIKQILNSDFPNIQLSTYQYPFLDSDNQSVEIQPKLMKISSNNNLNLTFDILFQKQLLLSRNQKGVEAYLSYQMVIKQKTNFYLKKTKALSLRDSLIKLNIKKQQIQRRVTIKRTSRFNLNDLKAFVNKHTFNENVIQNQIKKQSQKSNSIRQKRCKFSQVNKKYSFPSSEYFAAFNQITQIVNNKQINQTYSNISSTEKLSSKQSIQNQNMFIEEYSQKIQSQKQKQQTSSQSITSAKYYQQLIDQLIQQKINNKQYNFECISKHNLNQNQLKQLISTIYYTSKLEINESLAIIKELNQKIIVLTNNNFNQIYLKMQNYQNKFKLNINLRQIFPIQGLFNFSGDTKVLFNTIKQSLIKGLNENNIYKITKVIALVFKNNEIQQQINILFLMKCLKQFEQQNNHQNQLQTKIFQQKISALTEKISNNELLQKSQLILSNINLQSLRKYMIQTIYESLKKKDLIACEQFKNKWFNQI